MATRWSSQEVMRGALVVPVEDLDKSRADFQRPRAPVVPRERIPPPPDWRKLAREERTRLLPFARRYRYDSHVSKRLAFLKAPVLETAAELMGVTVDEVMAYPRRGPLKTSHARALMVWGLYHVLRMAPVSISLAFNVDHSSVHHAVHKIALRYPEQCAELKRRCLP